MYTFIVNACVDEPNYQGHFCDESCTNYKVINRDLQLAFFHSPHKAALKYAATLMQDSRLENLQDSYCVDSDNNLIIMAHITHQVAMEFNVKHEELWMGDVAGDFAQLIDDLVTKQPVFTSV